MMPRWQQSIGWLSALGVLLMLPCLFSLPPARADLSPNDTPRATAAPSLTGQPPISFTRLSIAQGLSQNTVLCILQDQQGFMWFGTQDGLNRFDGYRFTIYRHNSADPGSLRDNYILSLYEDRAGVLWVGTNKGGLNRYDRQTEQFTAYVHNPADEESLSLNAVTAMVEDRHGWLWVATDGGGLNRFDRRTGKFKRFLHAPTTPENRRLNIVVALYLDQADTLWLGSSQGLSSLKLHSYETRLYPHDPGDPHSLSHSRVQTITEDHTGTLWVGTQNGLDRLDRPSGRFTHFRHDPARPTSLSSNNIIQVYQDRQDQLWLATFQGLDRFEPEAEQFTHLVADPLSPRALSGNKILAIYEDRAGSLWVAAQDAGLNRYDPQAKPFVNFTHDPSNPHSLSHNSVVAFFEDRAGRLLVGTRAGVNQFDPASRQFKLLPLTAAHQPMKTPLVVNAFAEDRQGRLWLGAGGGFYRVERAPHGVLRTRFFPSPSLHSICVVRDGTILLATHGGGLLHFDPATERLTRFTKDPQNPQSLSDDLVYVVYEDRRGDLWIGTDQGLNRLDLATGRFTRWLHDPQDAASLNYNLVWSIYEDRAGRLWVGTGGGLNLFDRATQRFSHFTEKDGLPNANIIGILEDARGQLWLGTHKGVSRFDPATRAVRNYDVADGLFGNEIGQGVYYQNRAGVFFFGGPAGFSAFRPEQIQDDQTPPPIVLTGGRRYNTDVASGIALAEKGIAARPALEFSYKDNILTFEFAALNFRQPEKNQYAYQLAGYSDRWIQLGNKRDVTFTNLDAGAYTLRVRGSNSDGVWNLAGASLHIRITPPFWRRWWFVGLELLLSVGLALGAYRWRIAAWQRRNEQQQAFARQLIASQESERKRIAAELHDSLGQHLLIIKNRAVLGGSVAQDHTPAREQFDEITASATQAIGEVRQIAYNLRPLNLDRLGLTAALEEMVEKVAAASGVEFSADIEPLDGLLAAEAQINLYRVIQETVNNIVRHAAATKANVEIWREDSHLHVTVRDNGRGLNTEAPARRGLGLTSIAERVRILDGAHSIDSAPDQGTTINISIPIAQTNENVNRADVFAR